ncbi:hypothetical protein Cgig2_010811 [Carnegiea gigantea]|uniref:Uncharacterized protein n=1 Tax=Carnegiea gigantea TaxID=171969 RepID=A0A9Q1JPY3_9CARY|nr:hypothetical protein Cgig2_010811 [Carnegiea gigantea]
MNLFPYFASTVQVAEYVRDNFRWALRDPSAPGPRPLPSDYHSLCPRFYLGVVTRYAYDSNTQEMVQIIFYGMVIDDVTELGIPRRLTMDFVTDNLCLVRESSSLRPNLLPLHFMAYYPEFDHIVAMQLTHAAHIPEMMQAIFYAMDSNIPEVVQAIFYAMVMWDPFEFWFENVEYRLRAARALRPMNPPADLTSSSGPVEASGLSDASPMSSDEE